MSSKPQRRKGYPLPENEWESETQSFCIIIPAGIEWEMAMRGQLYLLGKWWMWKRDSSRPKASSDSATTWRTLLEISEDCGGDMATKEDIRDGMYEAMNRLALQIATGSYADISLITDGDGTVSQPSGEAAVDLPEDDPATAINETESARYGGSVELGSKISLFLSKLDTYYGVTNGTPLYPASSAKQSINNYFPVTQPDMDAAIDAYYVWRASNGMIAFSSSAAFSLYLYCNGNDAFAAKRYMTDVSGYNLDKQNIVNFLINSLAPEFFSQYLAYGATVPSNGYLDAACVPMAYQEVLNIPYASTRNLVPTLAKNGHRLLIEVSGYFNDPDGDLQDAFWYRTAAGVLTRSNFTFTNGAGTNMPSDNQVPYNTSHVYQYTIDLAVGSNVTWSVNFAKNAGMAAGSTSPTSGFSIKITDKGLAISA